MSSADRQLQDLPGPASAGAAKHGVAGRSAAVLRGRERPSWTVLASIGWLLLVLVAVIFASALPLNDPTDIVGPPRTGPFLDWADPLGRDWLGRSQLSRLVNGARTSISVAAGAAVVGLTVGGLIGSVAGYVRGKTEGALNVLADGLIALPPLFVLLAITAVLAQDRKTLVIGLALIAIPAFYRLARASTMSMASRDFVTAAKAMGAGPLRILLREIVPNVIIPLVSYSFLIFAILVVAEGSLSFLGLGIPPPAPSWGGQLAGGRAHLSTDPHLVLVPGTLFVLTVLSLNIVGDEVRRRFDVKESEIQ